MRFSCSLRASLLSKCALPCAFLTKNTHIMAKHSPAAKQHPPESPTIPVQQLSTAQPAKETLSTCRPLTVHASSPQGYSATAEQASTISQSHNTAVVHEPCRLDAAVKAQFPSRFSSATALKNAIRAGHVLVNGDKQTKTNCELAAGDELTINLAAHQGAPRRAPPTAPPKGPLPAVLYEDEYIACVVKPPGIATLPQQGQPWSVQQSMSHCLKPSEAPGALSKARPVHRLDLPTGGLVMCAKTGPAMTALSKAFAERQVSKSYRSIVLGTPPAEGQVDAPLDNSHALTSYRTLCTEQLTDGRTVSIVDLWPHTGPHAHSTDISDAGNGTQTISMAVPEAGYTCTPGSFYLWAVELRIQHPITGRPLCFVLDGVPLPQGM